jgi:predicted outer membrane repeat protein
MGALSWQKEIRPSYLLAWPRATMPKGTVAGLRPLPPLQSLLDPGPDLFTTVPWARAAVRTLEVGMSRLVSAHAHSSLLPWNPSSEFDPARSVCLLAESDASFERCQAGLDGGAIYTSASIKFGTTGQPASTAISSNSASGSGGGIMAFSSTAMLRVESGYRVVIEGNEALLDGGGLGFEQGASIVLAPEGCDPSKCWPSNIGNGICDAPCLHRACNW